MLDTNLLTANASTRSLTAVTDLARSGAYSTYVFYEHRGHWTVAVGALGSVELTNNTARIRWGTQPPRVARWSGDPAAALRDALGSLPVTDWEVFGWVGFDFARPVHGVKPLDEPHDVSLAHLVVPEMVARFDSIDGPITFSGGTPAERAQFTELLTAPQAHDVPISEAIDIRTDYDDFRGRAAQAIEEIKSDRYSKVILSRRIPVPFPVDLPHTYRLGRSGNSPQRSFLIKLGNLSAAGFSPELVVSVDLSRTVTTTPLAGTRSLGNGEHADRTARDELENDPKEISEHAVSVRTAFREIEAISDAGSTKVLDFMAVSERGSVQHLASTVCGQLREDLTPWDALSAVFPAVTASGIPKRAAVEAIYRLDEQPRGLYSGAILTASSDGTLEAALALRTVIELDGRAWMRAGAGIVEQSTPEREFEETCEKLGSVAPYLVRRDG